MRSNLTLLRILVIVPSILCTGCMATNLKIDGVTFRQALLDVYTDQAMDNLIRAGTNQPFVQLAYRNILLQEANTYFGEAMNAQTAMASSGLNIANPVTGSLSRMLSNVFTIHGSAQRAGLISYYADPVTDQNDVYEAYLTFAQNPTLFAVSDKKPRFPVHMMRKSCGKYYFVPVEAAAEFQNLVLKTTFMRGRDAAPPPGYIEAKVVDFVAAKADPRAPGVQNVTFKLDTPVPNGDATMTFDLDSCRNVRLTLYRWAKPDATHPKPNELGRPTDMFDAAWNRTNPDTNFAPQDLIGKTVHVFSHQFPPQIPSAQQTNTQKVEDVLDRIRASQTQLGPMPLNR